MTHIIGLSEETQLPEPLRRALEIRLEGELSLPLFSATAARVVAVCQDSEANIAELARLVGHDQTLTAHVLRMANAVGNAPREPILSVQQAISRLGLSRIHGVALTVALNARVFTAPRRQDRIQGLWRHSITTAFYAQECAELLRQDQGSAFLFGLLHDVGMPIVLQILCDMESTGDTGPLCPSVCEAAMDEYHCAVGARLAHDWALHPLVSSVILHHHDPVGTSPSGLGVRMTALADKLAEWAVDEALSEQDYLERYHHPEPGLLREGDLSILLRRRERVLRASEGLL